MKDRVRDVTASIHWGWQAPDTKRQSRADPWTTIAVRHREPRLSHRVLIVSLRRASPGWNRPRLIEVGSALPNSSGQQLSGETSDFPSSHTHTMSRGSAPFLAPRTRRFAHRQPARNQYSMGRPAKITFAEMRADAATRLRPAEIHCRTSLGFPILSLVSYARPAVSAVPT